MWFDWLLLSIGGLGLVTLMAAASDRISDRTVEAVRTWLR